MFVSPVADFRSLAPKLTIVELPDLANGIDSHQYGVAFGFQDFPDPTFNGLFPDVVALMAALAQADWILLDHAGQTWGPIPVADILELLTGGGTPFWSWEDLLEYIIVV